MTNTFPFFIKITCIYLSGPIFSIQPFKKRYNISPAPQRPPSVSFRRYFSKAPALLTSITIGNVSFFELHINGSVLYSLLVCGPLCLSVLLDGMVAHSFIFSLCYSTVWPTVWISSLHFMGIWVVSNFVCYEYCCHRQQCLWLNICIHFFLYCMYFYILPKCILIHFFLILIDFIFSKYSLPLLSELFPIGPILAGGFYFPPNCHKGWPRDLLCPVKCDRTYATSD